jgi:RHS repeat-associated protein
MITTVLGTAETPKVADPRTLGSDLGNDRLVEVKQGGVSVARYGYDTQNLRVSIEDAGGQRRVLLDGIEELAEYEAGAMSQVARWDRDVSRVDALLGQVSGGKTYAVTDALGSVYGLTDATGAVRARYSYDVYGARTAVGAGNAATNVGFTGRNHDATGAMYYRARYYETGVGMWTQPDPLGMPDGPNRYEYVNQMPTKATDPLGLLVELYCRYADVPGAVWFGHRHCGVRVRCLSEKGDCPKTTEGQIPDTMLELSGLGGAFRPGAGGQVPIIGLTAVGRYIQTPWAGLGHTN